MIFGRKMSTKQRLFYCLVSAVALISYLCVGSLVFTKIERANQIGHDTPEIKKMEKVIENLEKLRTDFNISYDETNGRIDLQSYLSLLNETQTLVTDLRDMAEADLLPWNFYTGVHFCMTAVTTIGYGYIAPATQVGRGLCIPYIIIGIPLNIYLSANLGFFIAQGISKLYSLIEKCFSSKRSSDLPETHTSDGLSENHDGDDEDGYNEDDDDDEAEESVRARGIVKTKTRGMTSVTKRYYNNGYTPDEESVPNTKDLRRVSPADIELNSSEKNTERTADSSLRDHKMTDEQQSVSVCTVKQKVIEERKELYKSMKASVRLDDPSKQQDVKKESRAKKLQTEATRKAPRVKNRSNKVPLWFLFLLLISFCLLISFILFSQEVDDEEWTYLDCFYFTIVTFTTVGFGDLNIPMSNTFTDKNPLWGKIVYVYAVMELGLIVMAASITILSERWKENVRTAKKVIKKTCVAKDTTTT